MLKEMLADAEQESNEIEKDTNMWFLAMLRDHIGLLDMRIRDGSSSA